MNARPQLQLYSAKTLQSLLNRLRQHPDDSEARQRFDTFCRPLLRNWLRRSSLQPHDADDLVQQALGVAVRALPQYDPRKGGFLAWLRGILRNRQREFWRSRSARPFVAADCDLYGKVLNRLENHRSDPRRLRERENAQHAVQYLLARIQADFSTSSWQAFQRVMEGEKPRTWLPIWEFL